jgi:hypothetical protein
MREDKLLQFALENLENTTHIKATAPLKVYEPDRLGIINLFVENRMFTFNILIKQELRNYDLQMLINQAQVQAPLMIIAERIFPRIKEQLRENHIAYLEANGNIFFNEQGSYIWVDGNKSIESNRDKGNRAFTKTGLKVIFYFLLNEQFINQPYREIANRTDVGLGNINYVMTGLKELGFLLNLNKNEYKLTNKKQLLEKWIVAYEEKLKPSLLIGTFKFLKEDDFYNWQNIHLENQKTVWGGEPAGDLLTHHLRPGELTLYTTETRNELIKHYRLIPDETGNVKAYKKFWNYDEVNYDITPPLLTYVDLLNKNDKRCLETAQMIYEQLLRNNF